MQRKRCRFREDFRKQELLDIFSCLGQLLKANVRDRSFHRVYLYWRKFVLEILSCMAKKSANFLPPELPEGLKAFFRKPALYTVGSIRRRSRAKYRRPDKVVPFIRISGFWLEGYGFDVGKRFEVYPEQSQLVLRVTDIVDTFDTLDTLPSGGMSND